MPVAAKLAEIVDEFDATLATQEVADPEAAKGFGVAVQHLRQAVSQLPDDVDWEGALQKIREIPAPITDQAGYLTGYTIPLRRIREYLVLRLTKQETSQQQAVRASGSSTRR